MNDESTAGYHHVLGLPGHETASGDATAPPPDASSASEPTFGFGAVLPLPRAAGLAAPLPPRDPLEAPGAALGRYRLGGKLSARSGYTVHAALHPVHGECRMVVLDPETARARGPEFLIEARLLAGIVDPALVPVLESGAEPRPWFAQPLSPGVTLADALRREGAWPPERVADLLRELAGGLARVHAVRLVHGDLDPEQVLLPPAGGQRLLGLGTPVCVGAHGERQAHPGGPGLGPAPYAPPEVQGGARPDARADVWALGAIGLECLTARPPFAGAGPREVQQAVLAGPPPRDAWPPAPAPLADALARCLSTDPVARFADAGELQRALARGGIGLAANSSSVGVLVMALALALVGMGVWFLTR